jgi:hypothetical protein
LLFVDELSGLCNRVPRALALVLLFPQVMLFTHPEQVDVNLDLDSLTGEPLVVTVTAKLCAFYLAGKARFLARFTGCCIMVFVIGPRPAFRDNPAARLAGRDEQNLKLTAGSAAQRQGGNLFLLRDVACSFFVCAIF